MEHLTPSSDSVDEFVVVADPSKELSMAFCSSRRRPTAGWRSGGGWRSPRLRWLADGVIAADRVNGLPAGPRA
jgi:hypothetical protein